MLDEQRLSVLKTLVNAIIPADDDPSGWEAGVGDCLIRQFGADLSDLVPTYVMPNG